MGKKSRIKKNRQAQQDATAKQIEGLNEMTVSEKEELAHTTTSPELLHALAQDSSWEVRVYVAINGFVSADTLRLLSTDGSRFMRAFVAANNNTELDVLVSLLMEECEYGNTEFSPDGDFVRSLHSLDPQDLTPAYNALRNPSMAHLANFGMAVQGLKILGGSPENFVEVREEDVLAVVREYIRFGCSISKEDVRTALQILTFEAFGNHFREIAIAQQRFVVPDKETV